jgi:hypothetical protein
VSGNKGQRFLKSEKGIGKAECLKKTQIHLTASSLCPLTFILYPLTLYRIPSAIFQTLLALSRAPHVERLMPVACHHESLPTHQAIGFDLLHWLPEFFFRQNTIEEFSLQ